MKNSKPIVTFSTKAAIALALGSLTGITHAADANSEKNTGWRTQVSADYFRYDATYKLKLETDRPEVSGTKSGDLGGASFSFSPPNWESWFDLSARSGRLTGDINYTSPTLGYGTSALRSDLTEFEGRWRFFATKVGTFGLSFLYQNWDSLEALSYSGGTKRDISYKVDNYVGQLFFGFGKIWHPFDGRFGIGPRFEIGGGAGTSDTTRPGYQNTVLLDGYGIATLQLSYTLGTEKSYGVLFVDAGAKANYFYGFVSKSDAAQQSESQWLYGPYARVGFRYSF